MKEVLEIINQIKATSSRNEKEAILKQYKDNEDLRYILDVVYNPYIILGIKDKKLKKMIDRADGFKNKFGDDFKALIEYLKQNNTGRDYDVRLAAEFLRTTFDEELYDFYWEVITKDLKIGVTAKSINKAFGEQFIPQFDVMLAHNYFDEEDSVKGEFFITLKVDGHRLVAIKENGAVKFFTRKGQPMEGLVDIAEEIKQLPDGYVYDGELLLKNDKGLNSADLYRETTQVARKDGVKKNLEFYIFDLLPVDEFKVGQSKKVYRDRRAELEKLFEGRDFQWVKKLPVLYRGSDKEMALKILNEVTEKRFEGVMLNQANYYYTSSRTKGLLKLKKFKDADLKIVGFEEGEGKFKGTLGKIIVEYKNNSVGVGSGFDDATRAEIWNNKEKYLGKIAKIKYFEESKNSKTGKVSLRFPIFQEIRWDKDEPSYY